MASSKNKTLIVITGPTASGKTSLAVETALALGCDVISADSRQIFRDIPVGTAAPTSEEMKGVRHHFIATHALDEYFSAAEFERQTLDLLEDMGDVTVVCGGSMMYVDALCNGIDDLPTVLPRFREEAREVWEKGGLQQLRLEILFRDPAYYRKVDLNNHRRLIHALEIMMQTGVPYSSLLTGERKERPFKVLKFAIERPREELFFRINRRVEKMLELGLEEEARRVWPFRNLNSLNTVGYKEMFAFFDGELSRDEAVARIGKNTRVFAKKQLTWLKKDPDIIWLNPENALNQILETYFRLKK